MPNTVNVNLFIELVEREQDRVNGTIRRLLHQKGREVLPARIEGVDDALAQAYLVEARLRSAWEDLNRQSTDEGRSGALQRLDDLVVKVRR